MPRIDPRIPTRYRAQWAPAVAIGDLVHHTTTANLTAIQRDGFLEPRDPSPKHWSGLVAVFMADTTDPLYPASLADVLAHVHEKGETLVRLHVQTKNSLYRSVDPARTFQVISLDPIPLTEVAEIEVI